jgi:uncharacterized membrane protein YhhN
MRWNEVQLFTKPLLIVFLFAWFMIAALKFSPLRYCIAAALFFSWAGDVCLLMEARGPGWFMAGLASFLLAHIMYIVFFLRARHRQTAPEKWNAPVIALVGVYAIALVVFLYPHIGNLQLPVAIYALTIASMLVAAMHAFDKRTGNAGRYCITGAVLFLCSDSLLAINKFYHPFPAADFGTMATYGLAQFAIAKGSLLYLASESRAQAE